MRAVYRAGTTPVHRLPAAAKLLMLAMLAAALAWGGVRMLAVVAVITAGAWIAAGLGGRNLWAALRPTLPLLVAIMLLQGALVSIPAGLIVTSKLALAIMTATLVSMTTPMTALLATFEAGLGPMARLGVNVPAVSFSLAAAIRFVPAMARIAGEVREAQRARGLDRSLLAFAVPMLVRALREADAVAEAAAARGWAAE